MFASAPLPTLEEERSATGTWSRLPRTSTMDEVDEVSKTRRDSIMSSSDTSSILSYKTVRTVHSRKSRYNVLLPRRKYADAGHSNLPPRDVPSPVEVDVDVDEATVAMDHLQTELRDEPPKQTPQARSEAVRLAQSSPSSFWIQTLGRPRAADGSSIDEFSIVSTMSQLDFTINRWANEVLRIMPAPTSALQEAALSDLYYIEESALFNSKNARPIVVKGLLLHTMAETISEGIINCLVVTNSFEANVKLTRIHENIFSRDPTVAAIWRLQTFSAAEEVTPEMTSAIFDESAPSLRALLPRGGKEDPLGTHRVLEEACKFSRMLHGTPFAGGPKGNVFYRSFVPEHGVTMYPRQIELVKLCRRNLRGEVDRVGVGVCPGLVKVSPGPPGGEHIQTIVRRARVICECALLETSDLESVSPSSPPKLNRS